MLDQLSAWVGTAVDLVLVILGFSLIIVLHELGHFLAARWAGIRVLAFAVGFGPAVLSFRKGLGWRRGSSEAEVHRILTDESARAAHGPGTIGTTEYRLNALPFGGYVKMLGQEDARPTAVSSDPDSFTQVPVWKRMVVISAGVAMNMLIAAVLFVAVFMVGRRTEPAKIGVVAPGLPAATAVAENGVALGVTQPGLRSGDEVLSVNGRKPDSFNDLMLAAVMDRRGNPVELEVKREGVPQPLVFRIIPKEDRASRMLQLGLAPAFSGQVETAPTRYGRKEIARQLLLTPLAGVRPGMTIKSIGGRATGAATVHALNDAIVAAAGATVRTVFTDNVDQLPGPDVTFEFRAQPELQAAPILVESDFQVEMTHLLGLVPVLSVDTVQTAGEKAGLLAGDIFVQIGSVEWPSVPEGIAEIRRNKHKAVRVVVLRKNGGDLNEVDLGAVPVSGAGTVGFRPDDTARTSALVTAWPSLPAPKDEGATSARSGASLSIPRGSRIVKVDNEPVGSLDQLMGVLRRRTAAGGPAAVTLTIQLPLAGAAPAEDTVAWTIPEADVKALQGLSWVSPLSPGLFEPVQFTLKASNPAQAVGMGLRETHRVMISTYLTFARLLQGSIKVEHLKGPVGIAHIGTIIAGKGLIWLMFFMALISVNLAVVNFLPIPIADGGLFVFLCYEQITGKPVSPAVQNAATLAGLALIVGMFLLVTYNDIAAFFGG